MFTLLKQDYTNNIHLRPPILWALQKRTGKLGDQKMFTKHDLTKMTPVGSDGLYLVSLEIYFRIFETHEALMKHYDELYARFYSNLTLHTC